MARWTIGNLSCGVQHTRTGQASFLVAPQAGLDTQPAASHSPGAGDVVRAPSGVMHGKTSPVFHTNEGLLEGLPK